MEVRCLVVVNVVFDPRKFETTLTRVPVAGEVVCGVEHTYRVRSVAHYSLGYVNPDYPLVRAELDCVYCDG